MVQKAGHKQAKILVIDDDAAILQALKLFLDAEGYDTLASEGYNDYLAHADKDKYPDIIILDILLGNENGHDIAKSLKADQATQNIPIVMISAHPKGQQMATLAGADAYLPKPFEMSELLGTLDALLLKTA